MSKPSVQLYAELDKLKEMVQKFDEKDAEIFIKWTVETIQELGFYHTDNCSLYRPHSHSADCDCGGDETMQKIIDTLTWRYCIL